MGTKASWPCRESLQVSITIHRSPLWSLKDVWSYTYQLFSEVYRITVCLLLVGSSIWRLCSSTSICASSSGLTEDFALVSFKRVYWDGLLIKCPNREDSPLFSKESFGARKWSSLYTGLSEVPGADAHYYRIPLLMINTPVQGMDFKGKSFSLPALLTHHHWS